MRIKAHRQNTANLKFFLDWWGFKTVFNNAGEDEDEILVLNYENREELLERIAEEHENTGFVPYHLALAPEYPGELVRGDKAEFIGKLTMEADFQNISGRFRLALFEGEDGNNYIWKNYSGREFPPLTRMRISGRIVCKLEGLRGETLMLINYVRTKMLEEDGE